MEAAMPTQTARIPWAHLAVLVSQDMMAMDWTALVRLNLGLIKQNLYLIKQQ